MLHRKFELIPIKIGFFYEFLKSLKNRAKKTQYMVFFQRKFSVTLAVTLCCEFLNFKSADTKMSR